MTHCTMRAIIFMFNGPKEKKLMKLFKTALVYVLRLGLICVSALAAQNRAFAQSPPPDSGEPAFVSLGVGYYDFNPRKDTAPSMAWLAF